MKDKSSQELRSRSISSVKCQVLKKILLEKNIDVAALKETEDKAQLESKDTRIRFTCITV